MPASMVALLKDWKFIAALVSSLFYGLWNGIVWADGAIEALGKVKTLEELSRQQGTIIQQQGVIIQQHETEFGKMREFQQEVIQQNVTRDKVLMDKLDQILRQRE